ncbi:hypothetical protein A3K86_10765 [Photobacterium jeanii]|uniref:Uncharacterized protein n=1 Tax=Photobacterium jeanii TaxID=858640 RepID=A0A178KGX0_9GAMM|nr:hypothetical protein [Photobacterium jeanii]OAN16471.1 hypothetical protein A3K86_10765 [Photobacterium jeanii]PST86070.1 hypothetical protein C9I91_22135 [Photobacterium jeanii]
MSIYGSKEIKLLVEFQKLTSQGQLNWQLIDPPHGLVNATNDFIPNCYSTSYEGKTFIVYSRRYQNYSEDFDQMYFDERVEIAMIDFSGRILWEYSDRTPALYDLYSIVKRHDSGIDDIFSKL